MTPHLVTNKNSGMFSQKLLLNTLLNPLSPKSDQEKFSPNDTRTFSRDKVMRTNKTIPNEKITLFFYQIPSTSS